MLATPVGLFVLFMAAAIMVMSVLMAIMVVCELCALAFSKARFLRGIVLRGAFIGLTVLMLVLRAAFQVCRLIARAMAITVEHFINVIREPILIREREPQFSSLKELRRARFSTARVIAWSWFAPTCVLGVFLALSGTAHDQWSQIVTNNQRMTNPNRRDLTSSAHQRANLALPGDEQGTGKSNAEANRPKWIVDGTMASDDVRRIVVSSQLWSTIDEAKTELLSNVKTIVENDFQKRHHDFLDPRWYRIPDDNLLEQVAVKERYVEQVQMDFGTMYRLFWMIEVSPIVRTELLSFWKDAKIQNRTIVAGLVLSLLSMVANAGVLCASLRRVPRFSARQAVVVAASCATAWSLSGLIVVTRLMS